MAESRSRWVFMVSTMVLFVSVLIVVLSNREPRFEGRPASDWFRDAQSDRENLHKYGKIFVEWDKRGARFLSKKLAREIPPWKQTIIRYYNRFGPRLRLSPIAVGLTTIGQKRTARELLGYFEERAAPDLLELLESQRNSSRIASIQAMGGLGPKAAAELGPHLVALLGDPSPEIQYEAVTSLAMLEYSPDIVVPLLVPLLTNGLDRVRVEASYALGSYQPMPDMTMKPLVTALNDSSSTVRANAIRALGKMGPESENHYLAVLGCLEDRKDLVWARVIEATPLMVDAERLVGESDFGTKMEALLARGDNYNTMMVSRARNRLGLSTNEMKKACTESLDSKSNWRVSEAVDALAELDPSPGWALELLRKAALHPHGLVRAKATAALAKNR